MEYKSTVSWRRENADFTPKTYDRTHHVNFGSGTSLSASSAPEFLGKAHLPNPEELFTAAISSCFMLTFLYYAALKGIIIDEYDAATVGILAKNEDGKMAITEVVINPTISFHENKEPEKTVLEELFKKAHENCFISSSVKSKVTVRRT